MAKRRKIRRSNSKRKLYFDAATQQAIVDFQATDKMKEKEKIYESQILPSLEKLVENLILIYGFARKDEPFSDLKNDCVTFLYESLYKFDSSRGSKAFSYFNVVAKNWLILNSRRRKKVTNGHYSIHEHESFSASDRFAIASSQVCPSPDDEMIKLEFKKELMEVLLQIKNRVESKNDIACASAIITVFENLDQLDFLNKRAIFVYVRDISGLNSKQLSASMSSIRKIYKEIKLTAPAFF